MSNKLPHDEQMYGSISAIHDSVRTDRLSSVYHSSLLVAIVEMLPRKGIVFLLLNAVRVISIVSLLLLFSAVVVLMVHDSRAYYALQQTGDMSSYAAEYCYYPETEVPTSTWGLFWLQLDRFNILLISVVCVVSELCIGPMDTFFNYFLPILGPSFGTAPLGLIQTMTSASLLSHYQEGLPLRVAWLLFFVGLINLLCGVAFRSRMKLRRSLFRSKRSQWEQLESGEKDSPKLSSSGSGLGEAAAPAWWSHAKPSAADLTISANQPKVSSSPSHGVRKVEPIKTPLEAFSKQQNDRQQAPCGVELVPRRTSALSRAETTILRERAREENMRVELQDEYHTRWHPKANAPFAGSATRTRSPSITEQIDELEMQIKRGQAGASRDLTSLTSTQTVARGGGREGMKAAFQRRSLVLSRVVRNVKRASVSAATRRKKCQQQQQQQQQQQHRRKSKVPALPILHARQMSAYPAAAPRGKPSAWVEVDKSAGPPNIPPAIYCAYNARGTVYEDLGSGRTRYFTPIANRFSSSARH